MSKKKQTFMIFNYCALYKLVLVQITYIFFNLDKIWGVALQKKIIWPQFIIADLKLQTFNHKILLKKKKLKMQDFYF